ncbi:MAG: hypothetical protein AAF658_15650, partial [Myxococcota bacterium]
MTDTQSADSRWSAKPGHRVYYEVNERRGVAVVSEWSWAELSLKSAAHLERGECYRFNVHAGTVELELEATVLETDG